MVLAATSLSYGFAALILPAVVETSAAALLPRSAEKT